MKKANEVCTCKYTSIIVKYIKKVCRNIILVKKIYKRFVYKCKIEGSIW